ncbi:hypothetical protein SAMN02745181_2824 [Rubritalea squalenifaciens DSM 18772]|uniref:Verru_Chthon cassette protein A n=1 Tax=Rubritalea squalenifaciens DSM 18772 TaxID=1123071 RepID=A0A1M6NDS0_9BACT|nr:hypothetical protein [Rubritalea squalenifaciens]SHJ93793.1 hypothetical protein SAMN02745181_2824 [Rubritalea squalenifaciens DSM 18772]
MKIRNLSNVYSDRGFALVSCITVMALLLMVVLGMINLATSTSRISKNEVHAETAKANARLALSIAIGELQKSMGPDQRVSFEASLLDKTPETSTIDGVKQPHWTATQLTTWDDSGTPIIYRNDIGEADKAGLLDRRTPAIEKDPQWRETRIQQWLVSQASNNTVDPRDFDSKSTPSIELVSSRVGPSGSIHNSVEVPKVSIPSKNNPGEMGWWIGSENIKAHVSLKSPDRSDLEKLNLAGNASSAIMDPSGRSRLADENFSKTISHEQYQLALENPDPNRENIDYRQLFHSVTPHSQSLLVNTLNGGLRKDLSVFIHEGEQPPLTAQGKWLSAGLSESDNMVGPANEEVAKQLGINWSDTRHQSLVPRWGLLRSWNELSSNKSSSQNTMRPQWAKRKIENDDDRVNINQYNFDDHSQVELRPVLVEGSMYYNLTYGPKQGAPTLNVMRLHMYPRVVLWNPYNVTLKATPYLVYLRLLGKQSVTVYMTDGSREDIEFHLPKFNKTMDSGGSRFKGFLTFTLDPVEIGPGECLVFSHAKEGSTKYDLENPIANHLSATSFPAYSNFYMDRSVYKKGTGSLYQTTKTPERFKFNLSYAEDYAMSLKAFPNNTVPNSATYQEISGSRYPWLQGVQCSYKAGAYTNTHAKWNDSVTPAVQRTSSDGLYKPHYKTREGYRMRWFREHPSNLAIAPQPRHFQSPLANFNIRHNLFCRTPRENMTWTEPEFFGDYTRDLWHEEIDWDNLAPIALNDGKWGGNPFGATQDWANDQYILFDLPTQHEPLVSLARLQHLPVSMYSWHPCYAIGNAFPAPRAPLTGTADPYEPKAGWNTATYHNSAYITQFFLDFIQRDPRDPNKTSQLQVDQLHYDLSYEINHTLFDEYFLSGSTRSQKSQFAKDNNSPLANHRLKLIKQSKNESTLTQDLSDFHHAAFHLAVQGGFDINSTDVLAWKALLSSNKSIKVNSKDSNEEDTPFPRILSSAGESFDSKQDSTTSKSSWKGYRSLSDQEITQLAESIVVQVKKRGPFISMGDFINRRLTDDPEQRYGTIQQAIEDSQLNQSFNDYKTDLNPLNGKPNSEQLRVKLAQENKAPHLAAGAPGYLMQADILQPLAPSMSSRSDTFRIRAYGNALDSTGKVAAEAWCEAIVQRSPEPLTPDESGINPAQSTNDLGRKFHIISFKWLHKDEI